VGSIHGKNEILGGVDINHANTLRGQVHIGIVPWYRNKGLGTVMLRFALERCKEMGFDNIQVAPREDNEGAVQVILRNGGQLVEKFYDGDTACLRYEFQMVQKLKGE
jgi:predicted acetyltransferase